LGPAEGAKPPQLDESMFEFRPREVTTFNVVSIIGLGLVNLWKQKENMTNDTCTTIW